MILTCLSISTADNTDDTEANPTTTATTDGAAGGGDNSG